MKIEKELRDVWEMKEKAWEDTKDLKGKELLDFIHKDTSDFKKSLHQTTKRDR